MMVPKTRLMLCSMVLLATCTMNVCGAASGHKDEAIHKIEKQIEKRREQIEKRRESTTPCSDDEIRRLELELEDLKLKEPQQTQLRQTLKARWNKILNRASFCKNREELESYLENDSETAPYPLKVQDGRIISCEAEIKHDVDRLDSNIFGNSVPNYKEKVSAVVQAYCKKELILFGQGMVNLAAMCVYVLEEKVPAFLMFHTIMKHKDCYLKTEYRNAGSLFLGYNEKYDELERDDLQNQGIFSKIISSLKKDEKNEKDKKEIRQNVMRHYIQYLFSSGFQFTGAIRFCVDADNITLRIFVLSFWAQYIDVLKGWNKPANKKMFPYRVAHKLTGIMCQQYNKNPKVKCEYWTNASTPKEERKIKRDHLLDLIADINKSVGELTDEYHEECIKKGCLLCEDAQRTKQNKLTFLNPQSKEQHHCSGCGEVFEKAKLGECDGLQYCVGSCFQEAAGNHEEAYFNMLAKKQLNDELLLKQKEQQDKQAKQKLEQKDLLETPPDLNYKLSISMSDAESTSAMSIVTNESEGNVSDKETYETKRETETTPCSRPKSTSNVSEDNNPGPLGDLKWKISFLTWKRR